MKNKKTKQFSEENLGRKTKEKVLEGSEKQFKNIFDNISDGIVFLDKFGKILEINKKTAEIFGGPEKELIGKNFTKIGLFSVKELPALIRNFANALIGKTAYLNVSFKNKKGRQVFLECSTSLLKIGGSIKIVSIIRDVTIRKQAEEMLFKNEERFRLATQSSSDLIYEWDIGTKIEWFGNLDKLLGYAQGEFPKTFEAWMNNIHPDDRNRITVAVNNHLKKNKPYNVEYRVRKKDGNYNYWWARGIAVRDEKGNPYRWVGAITDITERKGMEEKLKKSEKRWLSLTENTNDIIIVVDSKGTIQLINKTMPPYTIEETIGKSVYDYVPKEQHDVMRNSLARVFKTGNPDVYEVSSVVPKIGTVWFNTKVVPIKTKEKVVSAILISADTTERKKKDELLRTSEEKFSNIFANINDEIVYLDKFGKVIDVNNKIEDMFGYKPEEVIGKNFTRLGMFNLKDLPQIINIFKKIVKTGKTINLLELEVKHKDGHKFFIEINNKTIKKNGKVEGFMVVIRDITQRKKTEIVMQEEKNKLEKYFNATGAIISFLSLDGKVLLINKIGCETLEYNRDDILNKNWVNEFILEKDRIKATAIFDSIIREKTDEIKYFESALLTKNRKNTIVNWGIVVIKGESDENQAILNIGINTTELAEARIAIDQLEELNRLKDDFLNISAHELKTPLTSIIGFSGILKEQSHSLNSEQQKYINIINAESIMLNNIIKRILTITRFESGREIINFEPINLAALIQSFQPTLGMLLNNKKAKLVINTEKNDIVVKSNKEKILEVIYNFVDNSLKYGSKEQTITISVTQPEKERVKIAVKDQGPGIPPEKIDKLFNKFSQLEPSLVRSQEGTGLGLYICKLIVDSLGGKIGVESEPNKGSTFYFTLPIKNAATKKRDLDFKAV